MTKKQYGDYQFDIYFDGLEGQTPNYPVDYAALERAAAEVLPPWVLSYVAGGAGDESTQRQRRGLLALRHHAPHARRRHRARPVSVVVRHAAADPVVHVPDRGHRPLFAGFPRRHRGGQGDVVSSAWVVIARALAYRDDRRGPTGKAPPTRGRTGGTSRR